MFGFKANARPVEYMVRVIFDEWDKYWYSDVK